MNQELYTQIVSGNAGGIGASSARILLSTLSGMYLTAWRARQEAYRFGLIRPGRVGARVVSIGNITTGGAGKTPATIHFARKFLTEGRNVVVLSRGYGRKTPIDKPLAVSDQTRVLLSPVESGDEPYLIAKKIPGVPVVVCGKRVKGAEFAIEKFGADVIVLDDGFQHIAIARDEDIVVIDCLNPFGFGRVLPRGLLREPLSALRRATGFLLTHADEREHSQILDVLGKMNPTAEITKSRHRPLRLVALKGDDEAPCDLISGRNVLAVSSIGNPTGFEEALTRLGARIVNSLRFKDHHWYSASDIEKIEKAAAHGGAEYVISTEKDGVRLACAPGAPENILLLEVELELIR